jgi:glycosyltransferase involved in cell wall biosynthesis
MRIVTQVAVLQKKLKTGLIMSLSKLAVYAIHPIMYQTPIFKELENYVNSNDLDLDVTILYGDDLSLNEVYYEETNVTFKPDVPFLMDGYKYKFLKNYAKDPRRGFFSRINPSIFKEVRREKYNAIVIHGYESLTAWLAFLSAKISNSKIIWRGESVLRGVESSSSTKQKIKRFILKMLFNNCDAIMYSCSGNKEYLKFYGVEDSKLFFIPCAVNNDFFQNERKKYAHNIGDVKDELKIDHNDMIILFSARFTMRKRPLDLLKALTQIDNKNITVIFVGDGLERKTMEDFSKEHGIKAVFTGFKNQSEISKYYTISDIDAVISDYDPSPKSMNEAMNFGMPIIVTEVVGTAHDLVKDNVNGYVIKVGDITTMAQKIDFFNKNRIKIKEMGKESLKIIEQWNYKKDVEGIMEAYKYASRGKN